MLNNWKRGGYAGKKLIWLGDSATAQIAPDGIPGLNNTFRTKYFNDPGNLLYGVTEVYLGASGKTLLEFLNGDIPGKSISDAIAANGDLYIFGYGGMNDLGYGGGLVTKEILASRMKDGIDQLMDALPNTCIVLRMANSMLDNGTTSQPFTDIMREAAYMMEGYRGVVLYDAQSLLFPKVVLSSYLYMADNVHPNVPGYLKILDQIVSIIAQPEPINIGMVENARFVDYFQAPMLVYPRTVEAGDYSKILEADFIVQGVAAGSGYLDFAAASTDTTIIARGDIVLQNGKAAFMIPNTAQILPVGSNIRLSTLGSLPAYTQVGGKVSIWRHKYISNIQNKPYVLNPKYNNQQIFTAIGGAGFVRLAALPNERPAFLNATDKWPFKPTDYLLHPLISPISCAGCSIAQISGNQMQISFAGTPYAATDFSMATSQMMLVGTKY